MSESITRGRTKAVAVTALALGLAAGGYGVAQAANGGSTSGTAGASGSSAWSAAQSSPAAASQGTDPGQPWGGQRSDETLLTGDTASQVKAAAVAKVGSGATVVRVETDADGHAAYEVHMVEADGTPVTVYVDKQFDVVGVESR